VVIWGEVIRPGVRKHDGVENRNPNRGALMRTKPKTTPPPLPHARCERCRHRWVLRTRTPTKSPACQHTLGTRVRVPVPERPVS